LHQVLPIPFNQPDIATPQTPINGERNSVMELQPHGHREFSGAGHFQELI
jgi:hypothetical protein